MVLIAVTALPSLSRLAAASSSTTGQSIGSESILVEDLDRLFRTDRRPDGDINYARAEAGRILLTTASRRGLQPDDRTYLVRLVSVRTGLSAPDAEKRVDEVIVRASNNIKRARRSAVILAFMTGAAALAGAAMAGMRPLPVATVTAKRGRIPSSTGSRPAAAPKPISPTAAVCKTANGLMNTRGVERVSNSLLGLAVRTHLKRPP
jgi:hypothetical protein